MNKKIIWFHDKALDKNNHALIDIDDNTKAIFVWDDVYFQRRAYSLKRLVFIYETLCEMPVDIIKGNLYEVMQTISPDSIKTFFSADVIIKDLIKRLSDDFKVEVVKPLPFVQVAEEIDFKRFFRYWNKVKKTAFNRDGDNNA